MYVKKHKPTICIKYNFSLPWFDAECYGSYLHKKGLIKNLKSIKLKNLKLILSQKEGHSQNYVLKI